LCHISPFHTISISPPFDKRSQRLSLSNLAELDYGKAVYAFQKHLERAVLDCTDRPGDKRARAVTLQFKVTPVAETNGNTIICNSANGIFVIKSKIPDHETKTIDFGVTSKGELVFNPDSLDDHNQTTMFGGNDE